MHEPVASAATLVMMVGKSVMLCYLVSATMVADVFITSSTVSSPYMKERTGLVKMVRSHCDGE